MEEFCRTCGKSVNTEYCVNIFTPTARRLLRSVRIIANCWVENVVGFPIYLCEDCQALLNKINTFRNRSIKIEAFLSKRKAKINLSNRISSATFQRSKNIDPLKIEESLKTYVKIEKEPISTHRTQVNKTSEGQTQRELEQINDCYYEGQVDSYNYVDASFEANGVDLAVNLKSQRANESFSEGPNQKQNHRSRKYTMRVGKRTMYIKMTNDQQPKRIVDRDRQWASARPCICEHCGRQFKDGSNLNVHLLRHTGTKNFECKQCNEKCYTLHLLRRHELKHTEGPYECTFCGLQYSTKSSRVRHEREACKKGRAPQSKTELIKRGERTFHCDVCDLWFLRAGNLTQHLSSTNHLANERRKNKKLQLK